MTRMGTVVSLCSLLVLPGSGSAQDPVAVPLRIDGGRLIVQVDDDRGGTHDFIFGLGNGYVTESAREELAGARLSLGGVPISIDGHQTVADAFFDHRGEADPAGVTGGAALVDFDILIDVPVGQILLKPSGRSVRWPGHSLTSPVAIEVLHEYLIRTKVQIGESVYDALLDLSPPTLELSPPIQKEEGAEDGEIRSFRMGYSGWPSLPVRVALTPTIRAWGGEERGFVVLGAPLVFDCALAVSWRHGEIRTCIR